MPINQWAHRNCRQGCVKPSQLARGKSSKKGVYHSFGTCLLKVAYSGFSFPTGLSSWRNSPSCQHPDCPAQPRAKPTHAEPADPEPDHGLPAGGDGNRGWRDPVPGPRLHQHRSLHPGDRWVVPAVADPAPQQQLPLIVTNPPGFQSLSTKLTAIETWEIVTKDQQHCWQVPVGLRTDVPCSH